MWLRLLLLLKLLPLLSQPLVLLGDAGRGPRLHAWALRPNLLGHHEPWRCGIPAQ